MKKLLLVLMVLAPMSSFAGNRTLGGTINATTTSGPSASYIIPNGGSGVFATGNPPTSCTACEGGSWSPSGSGYSCSGTAKPVSCTTLK